MISTTESFTVPQEKVNTELQTEKLLEQAELRRKKVRFPCHIFQTENILITGNVCHKFSYYAGVPDNYVGAPDDYNQISLLVGSENIKSKSSQTLLNEKSNRVLVLNESFCTRHFCQE